MVGSRDENGLSLAFNTAPKRVEFSRRFQERGICRAHNRGIGRRKRVVDTQRTNRGEPEPRALEIAAGSWKTLRMPSCIS